MSSLRLFPVHQHRGSNRGGFRRAKRRKLHFTGARCPSKKETEMKTSKTLAALALTVLAAVGANAETYDGV
ncbi:MAG: hypothetical protein ABWZ85_09550, partial [Luteibacter sp.]